MSRKRFLVIVICACLFLLIPMGSTAFGEEAQDNKAEEDNHYAVIAETYDDYRVVNDLSVKDSCQIDETYSDVNTFIIQDAQPNSMGSSDAISNDINSISKKNETNEMAEKDYVQIADNTPVTVDTSIVSSAEPSDDSIREDSCESNAMVLQGENEINESKAKSTNARIAEPNTEINVELASSGINQKDREESANGSSTIVFDGVYEIFSSLSNSMALDVTGCSSNSGAKVQLHSRNYTPAQRWRITPIAGTQYYTITNAGSGKALDVTAARVANGTQIQQYNPNGTKAQQWVIEKTSSGYRIYSALSSEYVLDVYGGGTKNGTKIQLHKSNGTLAQRWSLSEIAPAVPNGVYSLTCSKSGKMLDVSGGSIKSGGNVAQYTRNNTPAQSFCLEYNKSTGYYRVISVSSGLVLDVYNGSTNNGGNVQVFSANGTNAQLWDVRKNSDGTLTLRSAKSGKALDVSGGSCANNANVQIYKSNGTQAQKWKATPVSRWLNNGLYRIHASNNTSNTVGVVNSSLDKDANIQIAKSGSVWSQKWAIVDSDGDGFFTIANLNSRMYLTVQGDKLTNNANISQSTWSGLDSQLWKPKVTAGGVVFSSKLNEKYAIDIYGNSKNVGSNVQLHWSNNTVAQKFRLKGVNPFEGGETVVIQAGINDKVISVNGSSTANGALVCLGTNEAKESQKFRVEKFDNKSFYLVNTNSGKGLDVDTSSKTKIQQWQTNKSTDLAWVISFNPKTVDFSLKNVYTGKYLSANGSSLALKATASSSSERFGFHYVQGNLNGFDISSWQAGINVKNVPGDFVIVKVSEGTYYTNAYYKSMVTDALNAGKKIGLYHYAAGGGAQNEADYFVNLCKSYVGQAILILDWESGSNDAYSSGPSYAKTFLDRVYSKTSVKPMIYMSKSVTWTYNWSSVANSGYKLWVAQYPDYSTTGYQSNPWTDSNSFGAWGSPTMFQYTSTGKLSGYSGYLDLDLFYGDAYDWGVLASKV